MTETPDDAAIQPEIDAVGGRHAFADPSTMPHKTKQWVVDHVKQNVLVGDLTGKLKPVNVVPGTSGQVLTTSSGLVPTWTTPAATGATTASTVAGLGTASDGKIGFLRMGASPYEYQLVIYDATRAKWTSPVERFELFGYSTGAQGASTSGIYINYVYLSNNFAGLNPWFYNGNPRITAGLQPELRLTLDLDWGASGTATSLIARPMLFSSVEGGTPTSGTAGTFTNAAPATFSGANVRQVRRGPWSAADSTVSTSGDWWEFGLAANVTYTGSGTINWHTAVVELRWVG